MLPNRARRPTLFFSSSRYIPSCRERELFFFFQWLVAPLANFIGVWRQCSCDASFNGNNCLQEGKGVGNNWTYWRNLAQKPTNNKSCSFFFFLCVFHKLYTQTCQWRPQHFLAGHFRAITLPRRYSRGVRNWLLGNAGVHAKSSAFNYPNNLVTFFAFFISLTDVMPFFFFFLLSIQHAMPRITSGHRASKKKKKKGVVAKGTTLSWDTHPHIAHARTHTRTRKKKSFSNKYQK